MKLADIIVLGTPVIPTLRELADLERTVERGMPDGYRQFMLQLGEGILGGTYVRVYSPWRIRNELQSWRDRVREYWFWQGMTKDRALECILVGDTVDGDELIFHPSDPNDIWVLPRHSEQAMRSGRGLWQALEWLCSSGALTEPFAERQFHAFDSRKSETGITRR